MSTYLSLTNELLRRLNEVQIDVADFSGARNIQALAKDAINSSIREILHNAQEFPFLLKTYTQTTTAGLATYSFPSDMSSVDWESMYLKRGVNNEGSALKVISPSEYNFVYRPSDESGATGKPEFIYQTQDTKFGVTAVPDDAYEIEYKYWSFPLSLVSATDECVIPERYNNVIIDGAMKFVMMFRSNEQSAQIHDGAFKEGIKSMRRVLVDEPLTVRSTYIVR